MGFFERKLTFLRQTFSYVGWSVFWLLLWDIAVTVDYMIFVDQRAQLPNIPLTLVGSALIVLTSFRNTSAYQRWWEARTLWGGMVNSSRSFARQALTLIDDGDEHFNAIKTVLIERHLAYVRCLACQLSGDPLPKEVRTYLGKDEWAMRKETNNFANAILSGSSSLIALEYRAGRLDSIRLERLEATFVDMSNWQGGMERIANTPLPYPYVNFPRLFVFLFCVLMPGVVHAAGLHRGGLHVPGAGKGRDRSAESLPAQSAPDHHGHHLQHHRGQPAHHAARCPWGLRLGQRDRAGFAAEFAGEGFRLSGARCLAIASTGPGSYLKSHCICAGMLMSREECTQTSR